MEIALLAKGVGIFSVISILIYKQDAIIMCNLTV